MQKFKSYLETRTGVVVVSALLFLLVTGLSFTYFSSQKFASLKMANDVVAYPTPIPDAPEDLKTLNILLLGYGGAGHQGGYLTDVNMVVHINFPEKKLAFISIPRDLWINFADGINRKFNTAFTLKNDIGSYPTQTIDPNAADLGAENAKAVASLVTNLPINYYIAIDFVGFQRAIGGIGGIEVDNPEVLHDEWYPVQGRELEPCGYTATEIAELTNTYSGFELEKQFPCRYEVVHHDAGPVHLEGGDALKFVRSRHSSSDFARSKRQQAVLVGVLNQLLSNKVLDRVPDFYENASKLLHSDIDVEFVQYAAPALLTLGNFEIKNINLSTDNILSTSRSSGGASILVPSAGQGQWGSLHQYVKSELSSTSE